MKASSTPEEKKLAGTILKGWLANQTPVFVGFDIVSPFIHNRRIHIGDYDPAKAGYSHYGSGEENLRIVARRGNAVVLQRIAHPDSLLEFRDIEIIRGSQECRPAVYMWFTDGSYAYIAQ